MLNRRNIQTWHTNLEEYIKEKEYDKYLVLLISRGKAILTKLRHYVSKDTLPMLYFAFVQLNIDYGLNVWGSAMPSALKPTGFSK